MISKRSENVEHWIAALTRIYPDGLYFKELIGSDLERLNWTSIADTEDPLLLHVTRTQLDQVLEKLVLHALGPSTPCAVLYGGPSQPTKLIFGTIADIAIKSRKLSAREFYLFICENLEPLKKYSETPNGLQGKTVLVTRARKQADKLSQMLQWNGARVLEVPAIQIVLQPEKLAELAQALKRITDYSWLVLTSVNTVTILAELLKRLGLNWTIFNSLQIACIGASTAEKVREWGGQVSLIPGRFQAESLVEALQSLGVNGQNILLPRAAGSREVLPKGLIQNGATVHEIQIYRAELPESSREELARILTQEKLDFITFTSSSTVHNFVDLAGDLLSKIDLQKTVIASIGPITASTLREYGLPSTVQAQEFTIPGLVEAMVNYTSQ